MHNQWNNMTTTTKESFWRNFTWKGFLLFSVYWFMATLLVEIIIDYFDKSSFVSENFTTHELIKRTIGSLLFGFLLTVWIEKKNRAK